MSVEERVARHYASTGLIDRLLQALIAAGVDPSAARAEDLKPIDEFHIGGAEATRALLAHVAPKASMRVLDIGCGVGGAARLIASEYVATVHGVDVTPEFVDAARALSDLVGLSAATRFETASALELPYEPAAFDGATMLHVGMNISDKAALMREAARVLKPGGWFAIYDVMRPEARGGAALDYPVPWASGTEESFLESPSAYRRAAAEAGLVVRAERDRTAAAIAFFDRLRARAAADGPPRLGVQLLMTNASEKIANMIANLEAGRIAPTELVLRKPD